MDVITGFVPTGQRIDRFCRAKDCADQRSRQRPRSAGRAVAGLILLLLGFCLLICGGTIFTMQLASMGGQFIGRHSDAGQNPEYVVLSPQRNWPPACTWVMKQPLFG